MEVGEQGVVHVEVVVLPVVEGVVEEEVEHRAEDALGQGAEDLYSRIREEQEQGPGAKAKELFVEVEEELEESAEEGELEV